MKRITLIIIALFSTFSSATFAQIVNNDLFSIYSDEIHVLSDETYMFYREDGFIQLNQGNIISGLSISGNILLGELGFVRVVLESLSGNEYLVLETNSTFERDSIISFTEYCEETSLLDNVIPKRLIITISDASLTITEVLYSETSSYQKKIYDQIIGSQLDLKIEHINNSLSAKNAAWRAGKTFLSEMSYWEKKSVWGNPIPNLSGFDYYIGGIFTMPGYENSTPRNRDASQFVTEFDWRNRHGKNWITSIKNQSNCASCWAFSSVATLESYVNLYYNQLLNYDLSEQDVLSCGNAGNCTGGYIEYSLDYIKDNGVSDESCFTYAATDLSCQNKCSLPDEIITVANYTPYNIDTITSDDLKRMVIRAPTTFGIFSWWHFMSLIGFKTLQVGDVIIISVDGEQSITITADNPLVGYDAWIIKNSYGTSWGENGFGYVAPNWSDIYGVNELIGNVTSLNLTINDIVCEDNDGDGFYFWGIGPKPSTCPACAPDEADGDDSNPDLGPMNEYGVCASTSQVENITTTQTWNNNRSLTNSISIQQGVTLTITSNINIAPMSKIIIQPGGKLILDGATLTGLCPDKMWDGIYVVGNKNQRQLASYQGTLEVKNGSMIENAKCAIHNWDGSNYNTSGGIISVSGNSILHNNGRAAEFVEYMNTNANGSQVNDASGFQFCTFKNDDNNIFSSNNITFQSFVKMSGVKGIGFTACNFRNDCSTVNGQQYAIESIGSGFAVGPHCSGAYNINTCVCGGNLTKSKFARMGRGIKATNNGSTYSFTVEKTLFDTCYWSVAVEAVNNYSVTESDFDESTYPTFQWNTSPAGVNTKNSSGFTIEGNNFYTLYTTHPSVLDNGVYCQGSGSDANIIYRNTFEGFYYALMTGGNDNAGLQFQCNDFKKNFNRDVMLESASSVQGSSSKSAGNKFTTQTPYNITSTPTITYYHSGLLSASNIYYPSVVSSNVSRLPLITANNCNSTLCDFNIVGPVIGKSASDNEDIALYESLQQIYESRLADYDAAGYGFLLGNFEDGDADIVATARLMQDTLISLRRAMAEIANRNIDAILQDTVVFDREALNGWYNRINTQTAKYSLVNSYFEMGEYALARQELAAIPQRFALTTDELAEYDNFCQYQSLREAVYTDGRNYAQLTEDEIAELQVMVERNTGVSSAYANSVLCFFYGICRDEEIDIDFDIDAPMNSKSTTEVVEENAEPLAIYVYPNPADEELNILLNSLPEGKTMIEFHDVTGRLVLSEEIKSANTSINISSLRQGVYMYRIVNGDSVIARDRIVKE